MEIHSWVKNQMRRLIFLLPLVIIIGTIFFETEVNIFVTLPKKIEKSDLDQENLFLECVNAKDKIIHAQTFSSIDNPDVQREVLSAKKNQALLECRDIYPVKMTVINQSFEINIFDFKYRY